MHRRRPEAIAALQAYARLLRELADAAVVTRPLSFPTTGVPPARRPLRRILRRPAALVTAFAVALAAGGVGTALAADHAVPGDALYPIDVFVEHLGDSLGFPANHAAERFDEAAVLLDRGRLTAAIATAQSGFRAAGDEPWADAGMRGLAEATRALGAGAAATSVLPEVADLVRNARDAGTAPHGAAVSAAAHSLAAAARRLARLRGADPDRARGDDRETPPTPPAADPDLGPPAGVGPPVTVPDPAASSHATAPPDVPPGLGPAGDGPPGRSSAGGRGRAGETPAGHGAPTTPPPGAGRGRGPGG